MDYFDKDASSTEQTYTSPTPQKSSGFTVAAIVCGILSLLTWCTGFIGIALGSLGILFTFLSHRRKQPLTTPCLVGLIVSMIGLCIGLLFTVFTIVTIVIPVLTDPAAYAEFSKLYQNLYGISLEEVLGGAL